MIIIKFIIIHRKNKWLFILIPVMISNKIRIIINRNKIDTIIIFQMESKNSLGPTSLPINTR